MKDLGAPGVAPVVRADALHSESAEPSAALACTKAFTDDKGNRFVFPSMIRWPQDAEWDRPSKSDLILQAMSLDLALGTVADEGWFQFDPACFLHVRTEIGHRNFAHGGATVLLFAGPAFEALAKANPSNASASEDQGSSRGLADDLCGDASTRAATERGDDL